MPKAYAQLEKVRVKLEKHYKDMQDMEFTIEEGKLYMLQTQHRQAHPFSHLQDRHGHGQREADQQGRGRPSCVKPEDIERLFYPVIDSKVDKNSAAIGRSWRMASMPFQVRLSVECASARRGEAEEWAKRGEKVISGSPAKPVPKMSAGWHVAQGILTATGGKTSHAAVVARGWGKCCIVGCRDAGHRLQN